MTYMIFSFVALLVTANGAPSTLQKKDTANCPLNLPTNDFDFPHLIVPISSTSPNAIMGNTYFPTTSPGDVNTIFNFDIPSSRANQECSVYLTLPRQDQLSTSSVSFTTLAAAGTSQVPSGTFDFIKYAAHAGATNVTTWNTQPPWDASVGQVEVKDVMLGNSYKVWSGACEAGLMSWRMGSPDGCLWFFQDYNPCAIGMYVIYA